MTRVMWQDWGTPLVGCYDLRVARLTSGMKRLSSYQEYLWYGYVEDAVTDPESEEV